MGGPRSCHLGDVELREVLHERVVLELLRARAVLVHRRHRKAVAPGVHVARTERLGLRRHKVHRVRRLVDVDPRHVRGRLARAHRLGEHQRGQQVQHLVRHVVQAQLLGDRLVHRDVLQEGSLHGVLHEVQRPVAVGDALQVHVRAPRQQDAGVVRGDVAVLVARAVVRVRPLAVVPLRVALLLRLKREAVLAEPLLAAP
jgi:hypothetical protein